MYQDLIATDLGQIVFVHPGKDCLPPCPVHAPSDHHMNQWPLNWRGDRKVMERMCEHMVGHPDPDDLSVRSRISAGVHTCDGCCAATG